MRPLTIYTGAALGRYGFGAGHPFGTDRLGAFWQEAQRRGLDRRAIVADPVPADDAAVAQFHDPAYVARVRLQSRLGEGYLDYGDTPAVAGIFEAAMHVVGSGLAALSQVLDGESPRAFVPIGGLHHARRDRAGGFCVFNDVGVLIEALKRRGVGRIAYVDIDAHHGDGVYYAFEDDPSVYFADIHEDGRFLYPGTGSRDERGRAEGAGRKLNIPLPPGAGDAEFLAVWPEIESLVREARPQIVLMQAGADSIAGDPLTHLQLTPASHRLATRALRRIADEYADGRLLVFGGGGYNRRNLATTWSEVVEELLV
ncbi:MAG: acetoin utilization protein AcuC [Acidiferrobacteraceae bacterium]